MVPSPEGVVFQSTASAYGDRKIDVDTCHSVAHQLYPEIGDVEDDMARVVTIQGGMQALSLVRTHIDIAASNMQINGEL